LASPPSLTLLPQLDTRVMIVDNLHDRRQVMSRILELGPPGTKMVGYAETADTAVSAAADLAADVVLLEIQLPLSVGMETLSALRASSATLRIVVCSFHASAATRAEALERGASAYLSKPVSPKDLSRTLRSSTIDGFGPTPI